MNRRDFLKTAATVAALAPLANLTGKLEAAESKDGAVGPKVTRRRYRNTDMTMPLLGFGLMRLPQKDGQVDYATAEKMVDLAMSAGCNYFDTAYMYHGGESEKFVGKVLTKYPRESYYLTSKMPIVMMSGEADNERIFKEQLARTRAGYFDFYFLHWLNDGNWDHAEEVKAYDFLKKKQQTGLVKHVGFSYHGGPRGLETIAKAHEWELAQVQMNFRDWDTNARSLYEVLTRYRIPISVMGPLGGGSLASLSSKAEAVLRKAAPDASPASWMLRFIGSLPNVQIVLSGMSTMDQLEDNIKTFAPFKALTDEERTVLRQAAEVSRWRRTGSSRCTTCRYCMPCPVGVQIPEVFRSYNRYKEDGDKDKFVRNYQAIAAKGRASACVNCGVCLKKCPQKINIPQHMKEIAAEFKTLG